MNSYIKINYLAFIIMAIFSLSSCIEEEVGPVLEQSEVDPPVFLNDATRETVELLPENAGQVYEKFRWQRTDYGISLSTNYALQIDNDEDFSSPQVLAVSVNDSAIVTVEGINNALLALGLPGFEESTVHIRLRSTLNSVEGDTLYSDHISRSVITYQVSDCGNFCSVGLIGSATAGGWDTDTDMSLATPEDKYTWTKTLYLNAGEVKFRAGDDWANNWGGSAYPSGTATKDGPNIPITTAGYYKITFNDNTGDYTFTALSGTEFSTIGIIGDATAGGWDSDTDLTQDGTNPHIWTGSVTLTDGEAKFRAENDWANNWGATGYPSGVATAGGANIPVEAGTYFVWFNDATGEYAFINPNWSEPFESIGFIGTAQEGGWDSDTDMIQDPTNPYKWSLKLAIEEGEGKFRANNAWDYNWGNSTFPGGIGAGGGNNIVTKSGTYFITFHSGTGEYYFLK